MNGRRAPRGQLTCAQVRGFLLGRRILLNQTLDLRPQQRVALDGGVSLEQMPRQPRVLTAFGGWLVVVPEVIPQDLGLRRIGGRNSGAAMQQSARLIKV